MTSYRERRKAGVGGWPQGGGPGGAPRGRAQLRPGLWSSPSPAGSVTCLASASVSHPLNGGKADLGQQVRVTMEQ